MDQERTWLEPEPNPGATMKEIRRHMPHLHNIGVATVGTKLKGKAEKEQMLQQILQEEMEGKISIEEAIQRLDWIEAMFQKKPHSPKSKSKEEIRAQLRQEPGWYFARTKRWEEQYARLSLEVDYELFKTRNGRLPVPGNKPAKQVKIKKTKYSGYVVVKIETTSLFYEAKKALKKRGFRIFDLEKIPEDTVDRIAR